MNFWNEKEAKGLFQELSFHNTFTEKPHIKSLKNINLLHEIPFYDELNLVKISKAFRGYARTYKIEIINSKNHLVQLEASKSSINDLFKDFKLKALNTLCNSESLVKKTQRKWRHGICSCLV